MYTLLNLGRPFFIITVFESHVHFSPGPISSPITLAFCVLFSMFGYTFKPMSTLALLRKGGIITFGEMKTHERKVYDSNVFSWSFLYISAPKRILT